MEITNVANTKSWQKAGLHWNHSPSQKLLAHLKPHQLHRPAAATGTSSTGAARPKSESQKGSCFVRVGREVMGPMTQTRAAITAISAAAELDLVSMESLQGAVGAAALRAVPGEHRGPDLWESLARAHGLEANKQSQWRLSSPSP